VKIKTENKGEMDVPQANKNSLANGLVSSGEQISYSFSFLHKAEAVVGKHAPQLTSSVRPTVLFLCVCGGGCSEREFASTTREKV
jgi:hypothetical protein